MTATTTARRHLSVVPAAPAQQDTRPAGVLLAVDGNSVAHRAWHAYERTGMAAPDGRPIHAVHGFLTLLAGIVDRVGADALVVGFDDKSSSRRDRYPDYKAGRSAKDPDVYAQMDAIADVLQALGVQVVVPAGLEADDVLGSAAAAAEAAGWRCVIATSDKDSFGLISESTTVLRLRDGLDNAVRMTPAVLLEEYGVTPAQYLDYAALVGDNSDNLRGVEGIGPKTAVRLLAAFGTVDAARAKPAAAVAAAIGKATGAKLATPEAAAALERNRDLMLIRRDVPVDVDACRPSVDPGTVAAVLRGRHLPKLVDRVAAALCGPRQPSSPAPRQRDHLAAVPAPQPAPAPAAAPADPFPPKPCGACHALIRWVPSYAGHPVPLDARRIPDGPVVLERLGEEKWAARAFVDGRDVAQRPRYAVHWTRCRTPSLYANVKTKADPRGEFPPIHRGGGRSGPCSKCRGHNPRLYGPNASPLCPTCGAEAAARWSPAFRRLHQVPD